MGGTSQTSQTQASTTNPWATATPALEGILGQVGQGLNNTGLTGAESGALGQLSQNAGSASQFAPQIQSYAGSLFNGGGANAQAGNVSQNFQDYGTALNNANNSASGNLNGYQGALGGLNSDAQTNLAGYQSALTGANSGAQGNLDSYRSQLTPYANGSMIGNNPALQAQLAQMSTDITNQTNGSFAAAGRDFSGANSMALGRGISAGLAPVIAGQYNQDVQNQMNAAGSLYGAGQSTGQFQAGNAGAGFGAGQSTGQFQAGNAAAGYGAGNTTNAFQAGNAGNVFSGGGQTAGMLSGLQQQYLTNQGQGVQASQDATTAQNAGANATLQAEAQRRGIPVQALGLLAQIGIPIAGLGGQSTGQSSGTQQMSGVQQFQGIMSGLGSLFGNGGTGQGGTGGGVLGGAKKFFAGGG